MGNNTSKAKQGIALVNTPNKPELGAIWLCPQCGLDEISEVDGWIEYGDLEVTITRMGCLSCGYVEYEEDDCINTEY